MSGWTTNLLNGLGELLAGAGIGEWRPGGVYEVGETAIVIAAMPPEPERVVCLTAYPVTDHISQADVTVGVQVRTRAGRDPTEVQDLDDQVRDVLHGLEQVVIGEVSVVQMYRQSAAALPPGRDSRDRHERISNFYVDAMRPTLRNPF
jgi:hypothetical protein